MDQTGLSLQSRFAFQCHPGLACFNRCCRTPTIILSPYDIYRLKHFLGLTSGEFLARYTLRESEELSNLPLIFLDPFRPSGNSCPFLGDAGCLVYDHRPAACRLFPITMGSRLSAGGVEDFYFCKQLDYCQGFATEVQWTVGSWQANQGFVEYDQGRRAWLEIILKQSLRGPVDALVQALFATLMYDLDKVRQLIGEPAFQKDIAINTEELATLQRDELTLLEFGYRHLQTVLLGEKA